MPLKEALQGLFTKRGAPQAEQWDHAAKPINNNPAYLHNRNLWLQSVAEYEKRQAVRNESHIAKAKGLYTERLIKEGTSRSEAEEMAVGLSLSGTEARELIKDYRDQEEKERDRKLIEAGRRDELIYRNVYRIDRP